MSKFLKYSLLLASPFIVCIGFLVSVPQINNWRLYQFSNQLFEYPLPPNTRISQHDKIMSQIGGIGDQCVFIANLTMETSLSKQEIENYYQRVFISTVRKFQGERVGISVKFDDEIQLGESKKFELYVADTGVNDFWTYWDIRCN